MRAKFDFDDTLVLTHNANDRRIEAARVEAERAASRQLEIDAQSERSSSPQERIRLWERLHALTLPRAGAHPLIAVIAQQTSLSLLDVQGEQQRRQALCEVIV
jgi:FMN phosphatase YigB (HAD superfamily)